MPGASSRTYDTLTSLDVWSCLKVTLSGRTTGDAADATYTKRNALPKTIIRFMSHSSFILPPPPDT